MYTFVKIIVSAIVIGIVTEISKRFPLFGGVIAALPLVSLLSLMWLYFQGEQNMTLSRFTMGVLVGFPATAIMLLIIYIALKNAVNLFFSIGLGICGWILFLFIQEKALKFLKSSLFT